MRVELTRAERWMDGVTSVTSLVNVCVSLVCVCLSGVWSRQERGTWAWRHASENRKASEAETQSRTNLEPVAVVTFGDPSAYVFVTICLVCG